MIYRQWCDGVMVKGVMVKGVTVEWWNGGMMKWWNGKITKYTNNVKVMKQFDAVYLLCVRMAQTTDVSMKNKPVF